MFRRPHHQRIAVVLENLDADLLLKHRCLFGGGTAIVLTHDEYRESVDIDFICSSIDGYRELRTLVHGGGLRALMRSPLEEVREPRIDQYGIRTALRVEGQPIKFEIVYEGRVPLADPLVEDKICGVWTLTHEDRVATKLMANSDRWADDGVMSRDVIDLAMMCHSLPEEGIHKAWKAYGPSVISDFENAGHALLEREGRLGKCLKALKMDISADDLRARIEGLLPSDAPTNSTPRPGG